jgi:transposase-like protein
MMPKERRHAESNSDVVEALPLACADEAAAVEFFEKQRWGDVPTCPHCGNTEVYQMRDAKTRERSKRFLWRCHACKRQFTVRIGTVLEESLIPLRHWCRAWWLMCSSKKGVSALQIKRTVGITYKSALFLLHRIRYVLEHGPQTSLMGIVEADETYIGGKPRFHVTQDHCGENVKPKIPVAAMVQRGGQVRAAVIPWVTAATIGQVLRANVDAEARLMTDEGKWCIKPGKEFASHETVCHKRYEYVRGDVTTNSAEGFFSILKRGLHRVYHSVSRKHLPLYLREFSFRYNTRTMNDGERITAPIRAAEGKRLMYREPERRAV